ncbi:hypothetical protein Q8A67_020090 [Cirrhinus molitorella]|uniref:Uncharacterized protein n=1 Tax=Cirrhinus molitorella TaxID=172907 RepID=A0AA88P4P2_9TELE|nr:hypothetical protein Q8A67_020090 [Cirrhinus molitorella]
MSRDTRYRDEISASDDHDRASRIRPQFDVEFCRCAIKLKHPANTRYSLRIFLFLWIITSSDTRKPLKRIKLKSFTV